VGYVGYDCTADSLHVGHLVSIMMLRWLQRHGHKPIALVGGGTSKIGDPSGKDHTRRLLLSATIKKNKDGVKRSLSSFLNFGSGAFDAIMVDNADWLDKLKLISFLRKYGRHFTINRMLTFDSVRQRLEREQPLTFLEFNYMVMQAYDFLELARRHDCRLQMGGSDQWGNIVNGVELARRVDGTQLFGLTTPLITTSTGAKMGKTAQGAVWLNEKPSVAGSESATSCHLHHFEYYQYWRDTPDADVGRFLRLFTELPLDEIGRLEELQGAELKEAKEKLAFEATKLCRGEGKAVAAQETARAIFGTSAGMSVETLKTVTAKFGALLDIGPPTLNVPNKELRQGISVVELFRRTGLASSNSEARRLIRGGGARLNDDRITDETMIVGQHHLTGDQLMLSAGRKRHARIRVV
jgi:tyrosyl-tRNA synthetase